MHKILMSTNSSDTLKIYDDVLIIVDKDTSINEMVISDNSVATIIIKEGCNLNITSTIYLKGINSKIQIINENKSKLKAHIGISGSKKNNIHIENILRGSDITSEIKVRVISEPNSYTYLKTVGILENGYTNNEFLEDIKYLNEYPGQIVCLPELLVASDDVCANHNMTCASFDTEMLFYLESRGLTKSRAKELMRDSFLKFGKRKEGIICD